MPELPEVETVVRGLARTLPGRTIIGVAVFWAKTVTGAPQEYGPALVGRSFTAAARRGKWIVLGLDSGDSLIIHLRMTGRLCLQPAGAPAGPHTRVVWQLDDGQALHFDDMRKFGRTAVLGPGELATLDGKLGPEPLEGLERRALQERLRRRKIAIKPLLLDQTFVAGLGNIYADEALYAARIDPRRLANTLNAGEVERLLTAVERVLRSAVGYRGTTLGDEQFRDVEGQAGENQRHLSVFRRTGQACPNCGGSIERIRLGGRSTHFCPNCQR